MEYRPWFIIAMAIVIALSSVQNILTFSFIYDQSLFEYLGNLYRYKAGPELVGFYILPLIAGYSVYAVKRWSFPIFLAAFSLYMYQTYMTGTFPALFNDPKLMLVALLINLMLVAYFLLPTVRAAYFDPRVRWWEAKYRYKVEMDAEITANDKTVMGKISDVSEGGVFITTEIPIDIVSELNIRFRYHTMGFLMRGKVAHEKKMVGSESENGYGISFSEPQKENLRKLKKLIQALELLEFPRRPKRREWEKDFWGWQMRLITMGIGVTPDLPAKFLRKRG